MQDLYVLRIATWDAAAPEVPEALRRGSDAQRVPGPLGPGRVNDVTDHFVADDGGAAPGQPQQELDVVVEQRHDGECWVVEYPSRTTGGGVEGQCQPAAATDMAGQHGGVVVGHLVERPDACFAQVRVEPIHGDWLRRGWSDGVGTVGDVAQ